MEETKPMIECFTGLGIMSGTSVDGLDIAATTFSLENGKTGYKILAAETIAYDDEWVSRLLNAHELSGTDLLKLQSDWTIFVAENVKSFISKNDLNPDYIASHGHTIFHQPANNFTFQMGSGATLAAVTGIKTVCDFRSADVALGGQGAPLVPLGDDILFADFRYCLNLGGFANISFRHEDRRMAYDICGLNIVMNGLARRCGFSYDAEGLIARNSKVNDALLKQLNSLPFYTQKGPKSLGTEWINANVWPVLNAFSELSDAELLATFTEHAAMQIGVVMQMDGSALVTGGGTWNSFLLERIKMHSRSQLVVPDPMLVEFKEALIFSLLGYLRIKELPNTLTEVTGAARAISAGAVYLG